MNDLKFTFGIQKLQPNRFKSNGCSLKQTENRKYKGKITKATKIKYKFEFKKKIILIHFSFLQLLILRSSKGIPSMEILPIYTFDCENLLLITTICFMILFLINVMSIFIFYLHALKYSIAKHFCPSSRGLDELYLYFMISHTGISINFKI